MIPPLLVALSLAWLYGATLQGLLIEWVSSADASYGIVLVVVALVVIWRRRHLFSRAYDPHDNPFPGFGVLLAGLGLFLIGQLAADVFLSRISLVVASGGALWFLAGARAVRTVASPLVFLLMAIPLPALVINAVTLPLQLVASRIGETTLMAAGISVFRDGNLLELPSTTLEIADACSGLRSIVSLTAIGGLLAWSEPSWPRRLALVAAGVPIAIVINGLRITATGLACELWSPRAAADPWHTLSGWLTFVVSVFLLTQLQRALSTSKRATWDLDPVRA
jgi:exosortase